MPVAPLLDPNNRLLSWSTGDFSLYGAQPNPGVTLGPAAPPQADAEAQPSTGTAPIVDVTQPAAMPGTMFAPADAVSTPDGIGSSSPAIPSVTLPSTPAVASTAVETASFIPEPQPSIGSGGVPAGPVIPPLTSVSSEAAATHAAGDLGNGGIAATELLASIGHSPVVLAASATPMLVSAGTEATTAIEGLVTVAGDAVAGAAQTLDTVLATTAGLDQPVTTATGDAEQTVAGTAAGAADTVETAGSTINAIPDTTSGVVDAASTTAPVAEAIPVVTESVTAAADTLDTTASTSLASPETDSFAGTDPAGGIATLVGMVEADSFKVGPPDTTDQADTSGSILDTLADDGAGAGLLGDAAAHDDSDHVDHGFDTGHGLIPGL